jgi:hypothetical protein
MAVPIAAAVAVAVAIPAATTATAIAVAVAAAVTAPLGDGGGPVRDGEGKDGKEDYRPREAAAGPWRGTAHVPHIA